MKLVMDCENEHFEMECKAAYIVILDPEDSPADMTLAVMGKSSYHKLLCAIARTLDSFIRTLSEGNELTRKSLWKDFKKANYGKVTSNTRRNVFLDETRTIRDNRLWSFSRSERLEDLREL